MTGLKDKARADRMYAHFCDGMTQAEIGKLFGITRQGVSFVLCSNGYDCSVGGVRKIRSEKKSAAKEARDKASLKRYGMLYQEYRALVARKVVRRYTQQRGTARLRGIAWEFNLASWWKVWEESGKWELRGQGSGRYAMARYGDVGPYAPGNVKIITHNENSTECRTHYYARKHG